MIFHSLLSLQSNRIVKMEGLDGLEQLDQLYLSHNGIEVICGLEKNTELTTLDLAGNRIKEISGLDHLGELEDLWCGSDGLEHLSMGPDGLEDLFRELGELAVLGGEPDEQEERGDLLMGL